MPRSALPSSRSTAAAPRAPGDRFVQALARGLQVIHAFDGRAPELTLTEVADAAGLTRAGARRILLTLEHLGYVRLSGRAFSLTPRILSLGFPYLTSLPFWNLAQPEMESLVRRVHESCSAAVLDGTEIVYVLRVPTEKIMTISLSVGSRLPAFCTSMGRVLLSGLSAAEVQDVLRRSDLKAMTPHTETRVTRLKAIVAEVRERGFALVDQELEEGLISVAVPIAGASGRIIAAMNISGQANRTPAAEMAKRFVGPLRDAAQRVTSLLVAQGKG